MLLPMQLNHSSRQSWERSELYRLLELPSLHTHHLGRDAAALSQRQISITQRLHGVFPLLSTGSELDAGKSNTKLLPWQRKLGQKAAELQISFRQLLRGQQPPLQRDGAAPGVGGCSRSTRLPGLSLSSCPAKGSSRLPAPRFVTSH